MDNVVNIEDARKNKAKEDLKKLPHDVTKYLEMRELQIKSIEDHRAIINEFENTKLCFSKKSQLTGPQIDVYVSYKIGIMVALDNLQFNDKKIKAAYPNINLSTFE